MKHASTLLLLAFVALTGCSNPPASPPLASLSDATGEVQHPDQQQKSSSSEPAAAPTSKTPPRYTVRKAIALAGESSIPRVLLSAGHAKLCAVQVGDAFPAITLPKLGGGPTDLAALRGEQATVVLFWQPDRWMARTALIDMQRDIANQFNAQHVAVVGIAVQQPQGAVQAALNEAQAAFPQLMDTDGNAFATVGKHALPRLYVLDPTGIIVWFDIEYSEGTRRELWQTLRVLSKN